MVSEATHIKSKYLCPALEVWGKVQESTYLLSYPDDSEECGFLIPNYEKHFAAGYIDLTKLMF